MTNQRDQASDEFKGALPSFLMKNVAQPYLILSGIFGSDGDPLDDKWVNR